MKLKIFTEVDKNIGYGHLIRCLSLYKEARKNGIDVTLIADGHIPTNSFLSEIPMEFTDWKEKKYLLNNLTKDDYVIVDSYQATKNNYELMAEKSKKVLYIDDTNRMKYPKGIIVNPSLSVDSLNYWLGTNHLLLAGANYVILRGAFKTGSRTSINREVTQVLIIMGGTDPKNITPIITEKICKSNPAIHFNIVGNSLNKERKLKNTTCYKELSAVEMKKLMLKSDMAISAAGQTIHELIVTRTPFIAVKVAKNQFNNIEGIKEIISSELVLASDDNDFESELQTVFNEILHFKSRNKIFRKMNQIIDGRGPSRIIDALMNEEKIYVRKAKETDIEDVFKLSNEPSVRKHSINKKIITWDQHVEWFQEKLSSNETFFYVITNNSFDFLGQVRFNIKSEEAVISISLSEKIRGKGLSSKIITESVANFFNETKNINKVIAFIKDSNIGSIKTFEKSNFNYVDVNNQIKKYVLEKGDYFVDR